MTPLTDALFSESLLRLIHHHRLVAVTDGPVALPTDLLAFTAHLDHYLALVQVGAFPPDDNGYSQAFDILTESLITKALHVLISHRNSTHRFTRIET